MPAVIWLVLRMKYRLAVSGLLFHLLPRSSPLSLPSSYAFFLFCLCFSALSPAYRISLRRSCKARTFSVCAPLSDFWLRWDFHSPLHFLFFLFKFVFFLWLLLFTPRIFYTSFLTWRILFHFLFCTFYILPLLLFLSI